MSVPDKTIAMIADDVFRIMAGPGEVQPFTNQSQSVEFILVS
jgi:hypothetical protein